MLPASLDMLYSVKDVSPILLPPTPELMPALPHSISTWEVWSPKLQNFKECVLHSLRAAYILLQEGLFTYIYYLLLMWSLASKIIQKIGIQPKVLS